ncbi:hypothetical protein BP5796_13134 [Coleophoma crateriformis]|uniref:Kinesin light chain n=1 Tax=Coleophoma crateriformis TaxID=565419 RepID=A0A3D8Q3Q9_9HELO|nr:hypothetical protein BP5796_13134 [Coleophoma crateriformis]
MANLAVTYSQQGRQDEAEPLKKRVMEISKEKLGEDHPDTLTSMANLAETYRNQGRWDKAEELGLQNQGRWDEAEELELQVMEIPNLAETYRNQGRWDEAEELDLQVMDSRSRPGYTPMDFERASPKLVTLVSGAGRGHLEKTGNMDAW